MSDQKLAYASSSALTITLASLATDSNLLTGRESDAVVNTTNLYLDYMISGKIKTGTSPTASKTIEVHAFGQLEDTPVYPDVFDGTDSAETITNAENKVCILKLVALLKTTSTSDITYWFGPVSLASLFGAIPKRFGIFVTHNTGVNLNSTGSNHAIWITPVYATIT